MALTAPQTPRKRIGDPIHGPLFPKGIPAAKPTKTHPLYEIRDRANQLERDIIGSKTDDTEALLANVLTLTTLVRGLIVVAIAEMEAPRG